MAANQEQSDRVREMIINYPKGNKFLIDIRPFCYYLTQNFLFMLCSMVKYMYCKIFSCRLVCILKMFVARRNG
jgi:hypothetical protein